MRRAVDGLRILMKESSLVKGGGQDGQIYNQNYYQNYYGGIPYNRDEPHWITFFADIAERIIKHVHPKNAFDLGCAKGFLVEAFFDRGVDAHGVDISKYAISQVREDIRSVCRVGSIVDNLDTHYDVITCIEVLEHVPEEEAKIAIRNMTANTSHILFSSTPNDFDDPTHINVRPVVYWLDLFAENGFYPDLSFDTDPVAPWALFLKRDVNPTQSDVLRYVARCVDVKVALMEKDRILAEKSKRVAQLESTVHKIRTVTGWKWIKATYAFLKAAPRYITKVYFGLNIHKNKGCSNGAIDSLYGSWIAKNEPGLNELRKMAIDAQSWSYRPKVSLIIPVYDTDRYRLIQCIESVMLQAYDYWEVCLADGGSTKDHVRQIIRDYADRDPRIRYVCLSENFGIAGNSNEALNLTTGDYVGFLDHDDSLAPFALYEVVKLLNEDPGVDFVYSDEDKIPAMNDQRYAPFFKPDWSPDLFLSYNYVCHFLVIRKAVVTKGMGFRQGYDGAQDYDLFLRAVRKTSKIRHIPKVLYHWRTSQESTAGNPLAKPYALDSAKRAIGEYLKGQGLDAEVVDGKVPTSYRVKYMIRGNPMISIIIPTRDKVDLLKRCVSSIVQKTDYKEFEIVIVDNGSTEQETRDYFSELKEDSRVKIISFNAPFNFSAINNFAVRSLATDLFLFLNNDTEVIAPEWLSAMLEFAQREDVGAVGAKLYYPNDTVQHGGVIIGLRGIADHAHRDFPRSSDGYIGRLNVIQNVSAVTGACLMTRRKVFEEVGGFEERLSYCFNDVDLCLKIRQKGYLIVWTPYAELYHHESASGASKGYDATPEGRERNLREADFMREKWNDVLASGDPYYSPNLTLDRCDFSIRV